VTTVTVSPDLPGDAKGIAYVIEPGATYHVEQVFTGPRLVTVTAKDGRVVVTVAEPPAPPPS